MARVEGGIVIARPPDVVFDFVSDECNEPRYNPRMIRAEKVSDGPVGAGTRFRTILKSMGRRTEMITEFTVYDRPSRLASTTTSWWAEIAGAPSFEAHALGTRMRWPWTIQPKRMLKTFGLIALLGRRQEALA
jgi:hypothetical protein